MGLAGRESYAVAGFSARDDGLAIATADDTRVGQIRIHLGAGPHQRSDRMQTLARRYAGGPIKSVAWDPSFSARAERSHLRPSAQLGLGFQMNAKDVGAQDAETFRDVGVDRLRCLFRLLFRLEYDEAV